MMYCSVSKYCIAWTVQFIFSKRKTTRSGSEKIIPVRDLTGLKGSGSDSFRFLQSFYHQQFCNFYFLMYLLCVNLNTMFTGAGTRVSWAVWQVRGHPTGDNTRVHGWYHPLSQVCPFTNCSRVERWFLQVIDFLLSQVRTGAGLLYFRIIIPFWS